MGRVELLEIVAHDVAARRRYIQEHPDQLAGFDQMKAELAETIALMELKAEELELISLGVILGADALDTCLMGAAQHAHEEAVATGQSHIDVVTPDPKVVSVQVILALAETLAPEDIKPT